MSHPIQYQAPLLRYLARRAELDLTVFFLSDLSTGAYVDPGFGVPVRWDVSLLDGYRYIFLPAVGRRDRLSFWRPFVHGLRRHLKAGQFHALWVHGYAHHANLRAIGVARSLGIKVLLRGESHLHHRARSPLRAWVKDRILPWLLRRVDGFLAIGMLNREFYLHYGVPEERIFTMPYAVDNDFFRRQTAEAGPRREKLREELGLDPGQPVILYASKFLKRKRPSDLLDAYVRLSADGAREPAPYLLFVGDGAERPALQARVRVLRWSSVKFLGFKNQTELPRYYDLCDVFVLPSEDEPWGLVVNEVMNAGKPVIVTDRVGCGPDLVHHGENGFVVPVGDVEALARCLRQLTADSELARNMGHASQRIISAWDFQADLQGLVQALEYAVGRTAA
ncbi:MAG TPA: glycosyltransferase family 4 protein [Gemmatimonadales bacterium]|nr:glycosyltransferase family 4 protein [Gemmatimonadales bacterium]